MTRQPLAIAATILAGVAWSQQPEEPGEAESSISGVVVSATTAEPVRGAVVWARRVSRGRGAGPRPTALTNPTGTFLLEGLPAGTYALYVAKTGFERRSRSPELGRVTVNGRDSEDEVRLKLRPAAAIEGRITDEAGEPLRAEVKVFRRSFRPDALAPLESVGSASSNDLGEYRVFALPAGSYLVAAWPSPEWGPASLIHRHRAQFYPSADSSAGAVELTLDWGAERTGIDFRLPPAPRTDLTVSVSNSTGPCEKCSFEARSLETGYLYGIDTNSRGVGSILGLSPGRYLVSSARHFDPPASAYKIVELAGDRPETIALRLLQGVTVSGVVEFDDPPEDLAAALSRRPLTVALSPKLPSDVAARPAPVAADGTFQLENVPAGVHRIELRGTPAGGYLESLQVARREQAQPAFAVPAEAPVRDVRLTISFDGATVAGSVDQPDSGLPPRAVVRLYPEGGTDGFRPIRTTRINADGGFELTAVVPGQYRAYALSDVDAFDLHDPAVRQRLQRHSEPINLDPREKAQLELDLISE